MLLSLLYVFFLRFSSEFCQVCRDYSSETATLEMRMREIKNHFNPPQQGICIAKFSTSSHSNTPHCMEWCLKCEVLIRINYYYLFFRCLASSLTLSFESRMRVFNVQSKSSNDFRMSHTAKKKIIIMRVNKSEIKICKCEFIHVDLNN